MIQPVQDLREPNIYHLNGMRFSYDEVRMGNFAFIAEACGVEEWEVRQWYDNHRPKSWQEKFIEMWADCARAQDRKRTKPHGTD